MSETKTIPVITAADVYQYCLSGHMANHRLPKWFSGTAIEFIELYKQQATETPAVREGER